MDLKAYYRKIREVAKSLAGEYQLVVSLVTPDGGKAGVVTEVATAIASRLIVEAKARKATDEEAKKFREEQKAKREEALKTAVSQSLQTQLARGLEVWLGTKASDRGAAGKEQQKS